MPNQFVVSNSSIPVDSDQRINLNALHRASGVGKSKQPNNWLRLDSTKDLINELEQSSDLRTGIVNKIRGGTTPGTFAHQLIAISYAGWISPKFQLEVNRVFLENKTQPLPGYSPGAGCV
ncbi:KilA-N domain protein [Vibrio aerogenes CECT 7868]|uniref:KilA-N domain protein n=1 Tax=Vibrio aerogenes CECT 7868 TaxID=1216006 RepID=A0A1M5Z984_9VIBR|nr:KilA-N domain-containing protein [Vibrio aerogenes]SHI20742.1 KilA-N domain protein [Vibrio aerogenes CECT 7868]